MAKTALFNHLQSFLKSFAPNKEALQESRRQFLKRAFFASLSASYLSSEAVLAAFDKHREPITIVGAGLAGLTLAYRLSQAGIPVEIFEANKRLGGRIHTAYNFNAQRMYAELGGEFIDTGHKEIISLCRELGLELRESADDKKALYYFAGQRRTEEELKNNLNQLYKFVATDLKVSDGQLPNYKNHYGLAKLDRMNLKEYLEAKKDLDSWFIKMIEVAYTGELGLEPEEQSCLNLLLLFGSGSQNSPCLLGESDELIRIVGGNQRLIEALADKLKGKIRLQTDRQLVRILDAGNYLKLTFASKGSRAVEHKASRAVLTLPFSLLRSVEGIEAFSPIKQKAILEYGYGSNAKNILGFQTRFWLPQEANFNDCIYTDLPSQCFWEESHSQAGTSAIVTNFLGGKAGEHKSLDVIERISDDLKQLLPNDELKLDGYAAYKYWLNDNFARGSYSCPKPGQFTSFIGCEAEPELQNKLFFAGEHCSSTSAGFMNGAVQSANEAAGQILATVSGQALSKF